MSSIATKLSNCCGERTVASEEERRKAAASGRPPPPRDDGTLWSFATNNSLLSGLHSHLFGESSGSTCLGTRAPAPEAVVQKASETGRPPPAPVQAPKFPSPSEVSSDDLAGRSPLSSSSIPGSRQSKQVCPACGEICESRHKFCALCGSPIASSRSVTQSGMPPKARSHNVSRRATDEDLANLVPSDNEDEFARPSPEIARLRPEPSAMSPESQSSRAPKPILSNSRQRAKDVEPDEVDDDVLASYYRLRGLEPPSQKTSVKASPAPTTAAPQLHDRPSSSSGKLGSREPDPQHSPLASPSPSERSARTAELGTGKLVISRGPDPRHSPLASPHPSEQSARTAEFGTGGYSRESAESRKAPPAVVEDSRQSPPSSPQEAPSLPKPAANKQAQSVQWSWPKWALDSKQPCIEVYVEDDETSEGRWIKQCTPLHRVVHPDGHDQFLAAQYIWDDEPYEQDFEPHQVRPFWSKQTVLDMARDGTLESMRRPLWEKDTLSRLT